MLNNVRPVGDLLREWRQRRHLSQLALACEAEISTRHLSFLESGRSLPSREMILDLAERLNVPLRERNVLVMAAGYAPVFAQRPLGDPALRSARRKTAKTGPDCEEYAGVVVPLQLSTEDGTLSFFSTTTVFGTPVDITLAELALESFFPADTATAKTLHRLAGRTGTDDK